MTSSPSPAARSIVLASTSPYRRELLARLRIPFQVAKPGVDEAVIPGEAPAVRAERLAVAKATALAPEFPESILIGSDQVAALGDTILDKPGGFSVARQQLRHASGQRLAFHTALALHDARSGETSSRVVPFFVEFRELTDSEIERYLHAEEPYDCAASAKSEGLGITLLERMEGEDPTALVGLPLIALTAMLRRRGVAIP